MATFTTYAEAAQQQSSQVAAAAAALGNGHTTSVASTSNLSTSGPDPAVSASTTTGRHKDDDDGGKKKKARRRKVNHACLYCRRSHMTCDEGRPCQRCIKREIGHLCHDEQRAKSGDKQTTPQPKQDTAARIYAGGSAYAAPSVTTSSPAWPMTGPFLYQPETLGNEFSVLTDFLETLDERSFFTPPPTVPSSLMAPASFTNGTNSSAALSSTDASNAHLPAGQSAEPTSLANNGTITTGENGAKPSDDDASPILPAATKTEKFLLTAADQESGSRDERLNRVIRTKYEAGLLKPYNYVKGYARLSRWMDRNVSQESKSQILQPLSVLRPKFRAVAQSLRDIDLVFIEEAFERMLLDYDRVFSAMGVPACLWRRTGEIYKANREFAELVGIDGYMMRDGRLCIYELFAEESAVNYWEKYGHVAFDSSQKAVLTSCVLRYKPVINTSSTTMSTPAKGSAAANAANTSKSNSSANAHADGDGGGSAVKKEEEEEEIPMEEGFINCCFSFTIRRDKWGIPSMIVGNFIKC